MVTAVCYFIIQPYIVIGLTFQYHLDFFKGVYQVRVGNVYLAEVCTRGACGEGRCDRVTLTTALLNSDLQAWAKRNFVRNWFKASQVKLN